jgi:hypothetical protein
MSLSGAGRAAIYPLVRETVNGNPRLREPLFLYAASNGCLDTLLTACRGTALFADYQALAQQYKSGQLLNDLEAQSPDLPAEYRKVWNSYRSVADKPERDARVKELYRQKIVALQQEKGISTYRVCQDLHINNANVNAWLKHAAHNKTSLAGARRILSYLEQA